MTDPKPLLPESDQTAGGQRTPSPRPERALTREDLAEVLLRVLGVCLAARGIIIGVGTTSGLLDSWKLFGLDFALRHYHLEYLVGPAAEFFIGIYFLVC